MRFDKFEEADVFPGFEKESEYTLVNPEYDDIKLVKVDGKLYAVREESEESEFMENGRIYMLGTTWYMPFNMAQFLEDVELGNTNPNDFYIDNYEL